MAVRYILRFWCHSLVSVIIYIYIYIYIYTYTYRYIRGVTVLNMGLKCTLSLIFDHGFDWCQSSVRLDDVWMLSSKLWCTPANHTQVCLKRVVRCTVQVNSGTVRCWCERNRTKLRKWTAINDVLFDKNVCLCVCFTHYPDERDWCAASSELYVSFLFAFSIF